MRTTSPLMVSMPCADRPGFMFSGAECFSAACVAVPKPTPSTHDRTPITLSFEITTASSLVWLFSSRENKGPVPFRPEPSAPGSTISLLCHHRGVLKSPLPSQFLRGVFLKHLHFMQLWKACTRVKALGILVGLSFVSNSSEQ